MSSDSSYSSGIPSFEAKPASYFGMPSIPSLPQSATLQPPNFGSHSARPLNLGISTSSQSPSSSFGVSSPAGLMADLNAPRVATFSDFLQSGEPDPRATIGKLTIDMVADLAGAKMLTKAASLGKTLYDSVKAVEGAEYSRFEAVTCQVTKVATEQVFEYVGKKAIVGGTLLFVSEAVTTPPLIFAAPLVGTAVPQAYANMKALSHFAGNKAEADCHHLFSTYINN